MFAVIQTGGKQYLVRQGDTIRVEKLDTSEGNSHRFQKVLLLSKDTEPVFGKPFINSAVVEGTVIKHGKADKIRILKMKAKKNYRRAQGHRQSFTEVVISKL